MNCPLDKDGLAVWMKVREFTGTRKTLRHDDGDDAAAADDDHHDDDYDSIANTWKQGKSAHSHPPTPRNVGTKDVV